MSEPTAYWNYIRSQELLSLQGGLESTDEGLDNDEVLFITVHQIDELWFKLALRELTKTRDLFVAPHVPEQTLSATVRGIRRIALIFQHLASHFSLMETMTTRDYLAFRDKLTPASGFQSHQMREIELVLGLSDSSRIPMGHEASYLDALRKPDGSKSDSYLRVEAHHGTQSLRDGLRAWLHRTPIQGSTPDSPGDAEAVARFVEAYLVQHASEAERGMALALHDGVTPQDRERLEGRLARAKAGAKEWLHALDVPEAQRAEATRVRAALVFIESYRELPLLAWPREVIEAAVQLEQSFLVFRQRHARMVERVIGRRTGTGGSSGVDYLDQTALQYRVFRDVWAARTVLIRKDALPPVVNESSYSFSA